MCIPSFPRIPSGGVTSRGAATILATIRTRRNLRTTWPASPSLRRRSSLPPPKTRFPSQRPERSVAGSAGVRGIVIQPLRPLQSTRDSATVALTRRRSQRPRRPPVERLEQTASAVEVCRRLIHARATRLGAGIGALSALRSTPSTWEARSRTRRCRGCSTSIGRPTPPFLVREYVEGRRKEPGSWVGRSEWRPRS